MKLFLLFTVFSVLPFSAFANSADTVCDIDGKDVSFDLETGTPPVSGPRVFQAVEVGKKDYSDEKNRNKFSPDSKKYKISYDENNGGFSVKVTSATKHKLIFSASKTTGADGKVTTSDSSSVKGLEFAQATFTCH